MGYVKRQRREFTAWLLTTPLNFYTTTRSDELRGAPSHFIIGKPPNDPHVVGVAVLFKTLGRKPRPSQNDCMDRLSRSNWKTIIAYSSEEASNGVIALGLIETETPCQ